MNDKCKRCRRRKIEPWIEDVYNQVFRLDRQSVKRFLKRELRKSPLKNPDNSMNVLSGVVEMNSMYCDLYLTEVIKYKKEKEEKGCGCGKQKPRKIQQTTKPL